MGLISKLTAIGDAIRSKTGGEDKLSLDQMATTISSMSSWDLLWENDGTQLSMASGTVLDIPNIHKYQYIAVSLIYNTGGSNDDVKPNSIGVFPVRSNGYVQMFSQSMLNSEFVASGYSFGSSCFRNALIGENTLTLRGGKTQHNGGSAVTNNARAVPWKIWGIPTISGFDGEWYDE